MSEWFTGAGHIGISVADLDESIEFYEDVLGLKVSTKREKDAFIPLGDSDVLALLQYPGGKEVFNQEARPRYKGKAFTHFGLSAPSVETVFEFQAHLQDKGVLIIKEAYERWDGASFYFLDPNGHTLEYIYFDPNAEAPS
jgi:catechol 2,3-dioxygenase-like lactoylglutathione lyase family enzyme